VNAQGAMVPYFYDDDKDVVMALASQQGNPHWADFLRWVVYATIYAEEEKATQTLAQEMPIVQICSGFFFIT
jgi:hypothetical protein